MGLGLGNATNAVEGFGILCLASIGPTISVLLAGQWAQFQARLQAKGASTKQRPGREEEVQALI
jgi:hypothetical protein